MRKKRNLIAVALVLIVILGIGYVAMRLTNRGKDIIGVTTLPQDNAIYMNSKTGDEFVSGSGKVTVAEGKKIHLDYTLKSGSFDLAIYAGEEGDPFLTEPDMESPLPEGTISRDGLEGKGNADFEVPAGEYTVVFKIHDTVGSAKVSVK